MFLHDLKYSLRSGLRARVMLIWLLIFPIALSTLFKVAFGNVYESVELFKSVPAAVVTNDGSTELRGVLDSMESSENPLMKVTYADKEEAEKLLSDGDVQGIIYSEDRKLSLTVAGLGMEETLLKTFCDQFNSRVSVITEAASKDPASIPAVSAELMKELNSVSKEKLTEGNMDYFNEYFYNLIAMVALFGALIGLSTAVDNQANLSALGARKNCSPTPKSISLAACLISRFILQSFCMVIGVSYMRFILKIDFGDRLGLVYLSAILSGILGVSIGFAVGSIGTGSQDTKQGVLTGVIMSLCFLSGLMVGDMKAIIAEKLPIVNDINPAAVITDSFHSLNVFTDTKIYTVKIVTMLGMTLLFSVIGFILTRRRKYASL